MANFSTRHIGKRNFEGKKKKEDFFSAFLLQLSITKTKTKGRKQIKFNHDYDTPTLFYFIPTMH